MKKFLCYDTNDAASGKIGVNSNGVLKPDATVPSTNGAANQQLVTGEDGSVKWEDRLAYDNSKLVVDNGRGGQYVKVSDEVPSWATLGAPIKYWSSDGDNGTIISEDYLDLGNGSFLAGDYAFIIATDNVKLDGMVFPEKGVYFTFLQNVVYTTGLASVDSNTPEITWDGNIGTLKTIDPKYIPSELNEVILPSSTSGSSKKFKITVNDAGAISATEV